MTTHRPLRLTAPRVALVAALAFVLTGCSTPTPWWPGTSSASSEPAPAGDSDQTRSGAVPQLVPEETGGGDTGDDPSSPDLPADERQIARTASLTVEVDDAFTAAVELRRIATEQGGFVASEQLVAADSIFAASSVVVLSVPADRLDATADAVAGVGEVTHRSVATVDVTGRVVDLDARIRTLEASIARIRELSTRAGTIAELTEVERELTARQAELESLVAQRNVLANRVARSTLTVTLDTPGDKPTPNPVLDGLKQAWEAFLASVSVLLTLLGGLLPFALVIAAIAIPLLRRRRARRAAASEAAKAQAAPKAPGASKAPTVPTE